MQTAPAPSPAARRRSRRLTAAAASLTVHGVALWVLLQGARGTPPPPPGPVLEVALGPAPRPATPAAAPAPASPSPPALTQAVHEAPASPPPRRPAPAHASPLHSPAPGHGSAPEGAADGEAVGEAELAGAAGAGSGGGGACDMAARVQAALRRDRLVRAELTPVAAAGSRALRIWNGDWVAHVGQEGRGLAAVREAVLWEVGFSPRECQRETVHGLVLLVVPAGAGGEVRLALGAGAWRWSDLLGLDAARAGG